MPQLSLYIDELTLKNIKKAAKIERLSISKYVVKKLNESITRNWPENFEALFGSITDDSFSEPGNQQFDADIPRENF